MSNKSETTSPPNACQESQAFFVRAGRLLSALESNRLGPVLAAGFTFVVLLLIYLPALTGPATFTGDDASYIEQNPFMREPLSIGSLARQSASSFNGEYTPLPVLTFRLETALWGFNPKGFRLTNILLYAGIAITLYRLTLVLMETGSQETDPPRARVTAFLATLLLVLHPLHVESVSAISNRKEILYALFALLSIKAWVTEPESGKSLVKTIVYAALAQLSKGSAFPLPVILFSYDLFCRRMVMKRAIRWGALASTAAVAWCIFSYQLKVAFEQVMNTGYLTLTPSQRLGGMVRTLHISVLHLFWPSGLAYEYELRWPEGLGIGLEWLLPLALCVALGWLLVRRSHESLGLLSMALLAYVPYSNLMPIRHGYADFLVHYDHYLLLPLLLLAPVVALGTMRIPSAWQRGLAAAILLVSFGFAALNVHLSGHWKNGETLYRRIVDVSPGIPRGHYFLGMVYLGQERYEEAKRSLERARELSSDDMNVLLSLADAHAFSGDYEKARLLYEEYLKARPGDEKGLQNLANTLILMGRFAEARACIDRWLAAAPGSQQARQTLQFLLEREAARR